MVYSQTEKVQVRTVVLFLILTIMMTNEAVHLLLWKKENSLLLNAYPDERKVFHHKCIDSSTLSI